MIPEEEELKLFEFDSPEARKMKVHIDNLRRSTLAHQLEIDTMDKKASNAEAHLKAIEKKIINLSNLLLAKNAQAATLEVERRDHRAKLLLL